MSLYYQTDPHIDLNNWMFIDLLNFINKEKLTVQNEIIKEYAKELNIDADLAITAFSIRNSAENYFNKVVDQVAYDTPDHNRIRQMVLDWYSSAKTQLYHLKNIKDLVTLSDEDLNNFILSLGFPYPKYIVSKTGKIELLTNLMTTYSTKGSAEALGNLLSIYGLRRIMISEWWIRFDKNRSDSQIYAKSNVIYPLKYTNNDKYSTTLRYEDFTSKNDNWHLTKSELQDLFNNKENLISLPSLTSCFTLDTYNEISTIKVISSILQRKVQETYRFWLTYDLDKYNKSYTTPYPFYFTKILSCEPTIQKSEQKEYIYIVNPKLDSTSIEFINHEREIAIYSTMQYVQSKIEPTNWYPIFDNTNDYNENQISFNGAIYKNIETLGTITCRLNKFNTTVYSNGVPINTNSEIEVPNTYFSDASNSEIFTIPNQTKFSEKSLFTLKFSAVVLNGSFTVSFCGNSHNTYVLNDETSDKVLKTGYYIINDLTCGNDNSGIYSDRLSFILSKDFIGIISTIQLTKNTNTNYYWHFYKPIENTIVLIDDLSKTVPNKLLTWNNDKNNNNGGWVISSPIENTIFNNCIDISGQRATVVFNGEEFVKFPKNILIDDKYLTTIQDRELFRNVKLNNYSDIYSPFEIMLAISYLFSKTMLTDLYDATGLKHYFYNGIFAPFNPGYKENVTEEIIHSQDSQYVYSEYENPQDTVYTIRTDIDRFINNKYISYSDIEKEFSELVELPGSNNIGNINSYRSSSFNQIQKCSDITGIVTSVKFSKIVIQNDTTTQTIDISPIKNDNLEEIKYEPVVKVNDIIDSSGSVVAVLLVENKINLTSNNKILSKNWIEFGGISTKLFFDDNNVNINCYYDGTNLVKYCGAAQFLNNLVIGETYKFKFIFDEQNSITHNQPVQIRVGKASKPTEISLMSTYYNLWTTDLTSFDEIEFTADSTNCNIHVGFGNDSTHNLSLSFSSIWLSKTSDPDYSIQILDNYTPYGLQKYRYNIFLNKFTKDCNYDQYNNLYCQCSNNAESILKIINSKFLNELKEKESVENDILLTLENILVDFENYLISNMELHGDMFAYAQIGGKFVSKYLIDVINFLKPARSKLLNFNTNIEQNNPLEDSLLSGDYCQLGLLKQQIVDKPFARNRLYYLDHSGYSDENIINYRDNSVFDLGLDNLETVIVKLYKSIDGVDTLIDNDDNVLNTEYTYCNLDYMLPPN